MQGDPALKALVFTTRLKVHPFQAIGFKYQSAPRTYTKVVVPPPLRATLEVPLHIPAAAVYRFATDAPLSAAVRVDLPEAHRAQHESMAWEVWDMEIYRNKYLSQQTNPRFVFFLSIHRVEPSAL